MSPTQTPTPTLGQRIMADEPMFFKGVKIACFLMLLTAALMEKFSVGSSFTIDLLSIGGTMGYAVASCAVKDVNLLINQGLTTGTALEAILDTTDEIQAVKTAIKSPAAITDFDTALKNAEGSLNEPVGPGSV